MNESIIGVSHCKLFLYYYVLLCFDARAINELAVALSLGGAAGNEEAVEFVRGSCGRGASWVGVRQSSPQVMAAPPSGRQGRRRDCGRRKEGELARNTSGN